MRNFVAIVLMVAIVGSIQLAQSQQAPDCVATLAPCTPYVYDAKTTPPTECCKPLGSELKNSLPCVCGIYGDPQFMKVAGFNADAVLSLPKRCGFDVNLVTYCQAALAPAVPPTAETPADAPATSPASDDDSSSPFGAPSSSVTTTISPSGSKSGASSISLSGLALLGSFLVWAAMMFI